MSTPNTIRNIEKEPLYEENSTLLLPLDEEEPGTPGAKTMTF